MGSGRPLRGWWAAGSSLTLPAVSLLWASSGGDETVALGDCAEVTKPQLRPGWPSACRVKSGLCGERARGPCRDRSCVPVVLPGRVGDVAPGQRGFSSSLLTPGARSPSRPGWGAEGAATLASLRAAAPPAAEASPRGPLRSSLTPQSSSRLCATGVDAAGPLAPRSFALPLSPRRCSRRGRGDRRPCSPCWGGGRAAACGSRTASPGWWGLFTENA